MRIAKFYFMKKDNKQLSLESLNKRYVSELVKAFGGGTLYDANGLWVKPNGELVKDDALICELFFDEEEFVKKNGLSVFVYLRGKALDYKQDARQECVSVVIDGNAFII